jgi:hypothetical protein
MLLDADCVFFYKLNVDCVFYPAVTDELTSACPSLLKTTSLYITCIKGQIGVLSKIISVTPKKY